jgi:nucleoside-diphosphate-sugar epimerase
MSRILVTGGTGFIGSPLVKRLKELKHDVHVLSRSLDNLENIIQNDIRNPDLDLSSYDVIYHLAAIADPKKCEKERKLAWDVNVNGTLNILQNLNEKQHIIFTSTAQVYDKTLDIKHKEDEKLNPSNFYALTKKICEELIKYYSKKTGFSYTILRLFNIFGPGQPEGYLIPDVIKKYKTQKIVEVYNPAAVIDLVHVDDVVVALIKAKESIGTFNICSEKPRKVEDVYIIIKRKLGSTSKDKLTPVIKSNLSGNPSKFYKATGWKPKIAFEKAIEDLLNYYAKQR